MTLLLRALSFFWPIRVARAEGRRGTLEVRWENGRLVLNSSTANQSFGGLHTVWQRAFRAARLKERRIDRVLLLGMGAGSVVRILRHELRTRAPIVAVEDDPAVVQIAREHFGLDRWRDLEVIQADAFAAIQELTGTFDLIVVDLFNEQDFPDALIDPRTVDRLAALLTGNGLLMVNTIGSSAVREERVGRVNALLAQRFGKVLALKPLGMNVVFAAEQPR
jgi:spermidine synthase